MIVGEKVILKQIDDSYTSLIVKWRNNPSVIKNFIFRKPLTVEMHQSWLKNKVDTGEVVQYIIIEKLTNRSIGSVYFRDIDKVNNSAEFGIFIGEDDCKGNGYGSEAVKLFVEFGLKTLKLHRIQLRVIEGNEIAFKSYKNAGFKVEGTFTDMVKIDDQYKNIIFMAIINEEQV